MMAIVAAVAIVRCRREGLEGVCGAKYGAVGERSPGGILEK